MRKILPVILVLLMSSLILIGSSGTFVSFEAGREVKVAVVPHDKEYLAFKCYEGYAGTVIVDKNSNQSFDALTVKNYLNELKDVWIRLDPDYSGLPVDMDVWIDDIEREIPSGDEYTFLGEVTVGDVPEGEYIVPITFYARWNGGDAVVETCPLRIIVVGGPTIEKILLEGNTTVPAHTYEEWKVRILVTNDGLARNLTVKDTIPNEFDVDQGRTSASTGTYEFVTGNGATKLTWNVSLEAGESAYLDMLIYTKKNPAGNQEFTSCGEYPLNDGATIKGLDIRSNSIVVEATGCDNGNCCVNVRSYLKGRLGSLFLPEGTAEDYTTGIWVKNKGDERDFLVVQRIGSHFNVTGYTPSKGSVELVPLQNGKTFVKWRLHLAHNEEATLEIDEHTDGINIGNLKWKRYLLSSKPIVKNCNQAGGSRINVLVFKPGGCNTECFGGKNSLELLDMEDYGNEN